MKIAIAADHAGYDLKEFIKSQFEGRYHFEDLGTNNNESVDYPDFASKLAIFLNHNKDFKGVLICGSGIGISIAANRFKHIRAALCHNVEIAKLSRKHNDSNVLAIGSRIVTKEESLEILKAFLETDFESGRHKKRVAKLS